MAFLALSFSLVKSKSLIANVFPVDFYKHLYTTENLPVPIVSPIM